MIRVGSNDPERRDCGSERTHQSRSQKVGSTRAGVGCGLRASACLRRAVELLLLIFRHGLAVNDRIVRRTYCARVNHCFCSAFSFPATRYPSGCSVRRRCRVRTPAAAVRNRRSCRRLELRGFTEPLLPVNYSALRLAVDNY